MKTVEELKTLRDLMSEKLNIRDAKDGSIRVVVGMATCGMAAGARPVLKAFEDEVKKLGLTNVTVTQTGCLGACRLEPLAEVLMPGEEKVTYVKLTADKVPAIVANHLVNKQVVTEYTIGAAK